MKQIRTAPLMALLAVLSTAPAFAAVKKTVFKSGGWDGVRYDVTVDGLRQFNTPIQARAKVVRITLEGVEPYSGIQYQVGAPRIPVLRFLLQGEVEVQAGIPVTEVQLGADTRVEPGLAPVVKLPRQTASVRFDPAQYDQDRPFDLQPTHTITPAGFRDGLPLKLVTLYPVMYQPKSGKIRFLKNFTVTAKRPAVRRRATGLFAIVAGKAFEDSPALTAYADFKRSQGYPVVIGTMGKDFSSPDQIRAWLQQRLNQGLKYAMIVGDAEDVPAKPSIHIHGVTDHYYRAIDTADYEKDINGPDIAVGRLSVRTEAQLQTVVQKLMRYQQARAGAPWNRNLSFVATNDKYTVAEGTHNYVIQNYSSKLGYQGSFPASGAAGGDRLYAITHQAGTADLKRAFAEGRAIIDYSGHGSTVSWAGPAFSQSDVMGMNHPDALPFVIGNACITGQFTVAESFGETWIRSPAAAVAYWGSMDNTYWDEDDILEKKMFDGIFQFGARELGEITNYALSAFWNHYGGAGRSIYYWETYVLFGDPSVKLRIATR